MHIGDIRIESVSGGLFRLDGGAMFGVVPKPLWNRKSPADSHNRIQLNTNCLLIRTAEATILCDTGFGTKLSEKELQHIEASQSQSLVSNLERKGIAPEELTHVIFSHLHFDHAGGATRFKPTNDGSPTELEVTFKNAVHVMQRQEIDDAVGKVPELAGNYYEQELQFLRDSAQCQIVEGDASILPSIDVVHTGGHTSGHQTIWIRTGDQSGVYLGDICPTSHHLNVFWTMAYDAYQLQVRRKKFELFTKIAAEKTVIFFDHDPEIRAATIRPKNDKAFEVDQIIELE